MDSAPFALARSGIAAPRRQVARPAPAPEAAAVPNDRLWCEHGWGLRGSAVATVVGLILLASAISHLLG